MKLTKFKFPFLVSLPKGLTKEEIKRIEKQVDSWTKEDAITFALKRARSITIPKNAKEWRNYLKILHAIAYSSQRFDELPRKKFLNKVSKKLG